MPEPLRSSECNYEVVDARAQIASVRRVLRFAAETRWEDDQRGELSSVADVLAEIYELFYEEAQSEDGPRFHDWSKDHILRSRLNAFADFLRMVVEGTLGNEPMKSTNNPTTASDPKDPRS